MADKPFILLGVNCDVPEVAAEVARREGIAVRSWADGGEVHGGRIAHSWNVRALPATYIIDHRGIICHKFGPRPDGHDLVPEILDATGQARDKWQLRAQAIGAAVDELVARLDCKSEYPASP
jgi:hypothetical protein